MPAWTVEFYEGDDGSPVRDFLDDLTIEARAKLLALIRLLEEEGPTLPFPYSSQIRGTLRELRTRHGRERLRVLYFGTPQRSFVLLHGFSKRTEQTPASHIATALRRMRLHEDKREDEEK